MARMSSLDGHQLNRLIFTSQYNNLKLIRSQLERALDGSIICLRNKVKVSKRVRNNGPSDLECLAAMRTGKEDVIVWPFWNQCQSLECHSSHPISDCFFVSIRLIIELFDKAHHYLREVGPVYDSNDIFQVQHAWTWRLSQIFTVDILYRGLYVLVSV